jgi:hypothetical protein
VLERMMEAGKPGNGRRHNGPLRRAPRP